MEVRKEVKKIPLRHKVALIDYDQCKEWLLYKHYAHRMCPISYAFGLFDSIGTLLGCCVFGGSANRNNIKIGDFPIIELNRLVVQDGLEHNVLSFFVSKSLSLLPSPLIVISYADPGMGHHGYIYQATNWLYFGQGQRKDGGWDSGVTSFMKDGKAYHAKTVSLLTGSAAGKEAAKSGYIRVFSKPKHKYVFLLGSRKEKREMLAVIPYKQMPYPKGDNIRYDSTFTPSTQGMLF